MDEKFKNLSEFIFYSEVKIFSKELKIAGTIDVLAHDTTNNTFIIVDWKTSNQLAKPHLRQ